MCTVSWVHSPRGYQVLVNRDEKLTRKPALPPRIREREGVLFAAPEDGDFGGSWIAVNECGVVLALLNGPCLDDRRRRRSRGLLVLDAITAPSLGDVGERVARADLSAFAPFSLAALEPGYPAWLFEWDGTRLAVSTNADHRMPLTSSSVDPEGVRERRTRELRRLSHSAGRLDAGLLFAFHSSHGPVRDAYSTCMHRPDAATASFSWIDVTGSEIRFYYSPAAPCHWAGGDALTLARRCALLPR